MVVRIDDNICIEYVWERKFGYVEEFFFYIFQKNLMQPYSSTIL